MNKGMALQEIETLNQERILGMADKELGDQLIIDVDRYKVDPDCKRLVCFVYDVERRIGKPNNLMTDLNNQHGGFTPPDRKSVV